MNYISRLCNLEIYKHTLKSINSEIYFGLYHLKYIFKLCNLILKFKTDCKLYNLEHMSIFHNLNYRYFRHFRQAWKGMEKQ